MITDIRKIVFIGAGNLATNLAVEFHSKSFEIVQIISKTENSAKLLAEKVSATFSTNISDLNKDADLYIIAVNDNSISEVVNKINVGNKLIVHTSGSTNINVFENKIENYGVLYPLQTFSKNKTVAFKNIPVFIEAKSIEANQKLKNLASNISNDVIEISSEERLKLHLAAVFCCNFVNFMYTQSELILNQNKISFEYLKPLIIETANKILNQSPNEVQTGPAFRNDYITIEKHINLLNSIPDTQKMYSFVSESIMSYFKNHK